MARLSGKITAKAMGWPREKIALAINADGAPSRVLLGRIAGVVTGYRETVKEDTGEVQRGLRGQFRAISSLADDASAAVENGAPNGTQVNAGVCYLPSGIQDMVEGAFDATTGDNRQVRFALDLFAERAQNKAGYTYTADELVQPTQSDEMTLLLAQASGQRALPDLTKAAAGQSGESDPPAATGDDAEKANEEAPKTGGKNKG